MSEDRTIWDLSEEEYEDYENNPEDWEEVFRSIVMLYFCQACGSSTSVRRLFLDTRHVHSGDFTMTGAESEALDFMEWFCDLPYRYKVFIAGNHDFCLRGASLEGLDDNCHYLCNSGVLIEGIKFYGVPMFFEDTVTRRVENDFKNIPSDTDVLVTHQPPKDILDLSGEIHYGDSFLSQRIIQVRPRLHLFGHIHKAHGIEERNGIVFSNGAVLGESYELNGTNIHILTV